jgi:hypothetical protein
LIWAYLVHLGVNYWKRADGDPGELSKFYHELPTEDDAWRETVDFIAAQGFNTLIIDLGEGVVYDSHPELATKGAWSKEKLKKELDRIRSLGMTPIPKLNFASLHNAWLGEYGRMISTPTYYKVAKELIDEAIELFDNPPYLHLGMDEEVYEPSPPFNCLQMQKRYGLTVSRTNKLFWHDVNYLADCCIQKGVRPWIWGDAAWFMPETMAASLSKEVLVSNWFYRRWLNPQIEPDYVQAAIKAFYLLADYGFDQVPTGATYTQTQNIDDMMLCMKDKPNILGYMDAPWYRCRAIDTLKHKAEAKIFGVAKNKHYPDIK